MTATNHAMTGALIGLITRNPWIALPAAIVSHYVCDALPHYDSALKASDYLKTRRFKIILCIDAFLCFSLVVLLVITQPSHWQLAAFTAFFAAAPDLLWINQFVKTLKKQVWQPGLLSRFGIWVQWFAKPVGGFVELAWFAGASVLLWQFL